jgi:hypothetical protein
MLHGAIAGGNDNSPAGVSVRPAKYIAFNQVLTVLNIRDHLFTPETLS